MMKKIRQQLSKRLYCAIMLCQSPKDRYFEAREGTHPPLPDAM